MNLSSASPKTKVWGAIIVAAVIIGGSLVLRKDNGGAALTSGVEVAPVATREYQDTIDTDSDGMPDWQEGVYGTDPTTPDKPPEQLGAIDLSEISGVSSSSEPLGNTLTDRVSREIFAQYLMNREGGPGAAPEGTSFNDSIAPIVAKAALEVEDRLYTLASVKTSPDISQEAIRAYGNQIAIIATRDTIPDDNEAFILQRAIEKEDPEELKKLDPIIRAYKNIRSGLEDVVVPQTLANEHLKLLNAILAVHNDVVVMRAVFEDPVAALLRVQRYQNDADALLASVLAMKSTFEQNGVAFAKDEPGGIFFFSIE